jgi:hypothetical protein
MDQEFEIVITAPADRGRLAEIWVGSDLLAELGPRDDRQLILDLCPRVDGSHWRISADSLIRAIERAKEKLSQPSPFRID